MRARRFQRLADQGPARFGRYLKGICRDPDDDKFLACAVSASAAFVVSGNRDLLDLDSYKSIRIISPSDFLKKF